ncbi:MAG: hypothetical protein PHD04_02195 [Candidatus Pacebacteria bacterium]|nr:hypothetical protein [Candidatus Paceibacterota bacterium]
MFGTLFAFALLVVGEGINILAEMFSAKLPSVSSLLELKNLFLFGMVIIGCSFLLFGYAVGYQASKSIWTVTVASVVAILLVEPLLAYYFFHQLPEKGALVGIVLGAIGFIATVVWV